MLRIGLSGGIGAGKSTVSSTFAAEGGIVVDGDVIAREVVEPGTEGLAAIILDGIPGTAMPPWRPLISEADARWIADYLKTEKVE